MVRPTRCTIDMCNAQIEGTTICKDLDDGVGRLDATYAATSTSSSKKL